MADFFVWAASNPVFASFLANPLALGSRKAATIVDEDESYSAAELTTFTLDDGSVRADPLDIQSIVLSDGGTAIWASATAGAYLIPTSEIAYDAFRSNAPLSIVSSNPVATIDYDQFFVPSRQNSRPTPVDDSFVGAEDTPISGNVVANDLDPDGDALVVTLADDADKGSLVLNPDGTFTYTPDINTNGTDSFAYRVEDELGGRAQARVTLTIDPVNDAPNAEDDSYEIDEDGVLSRIAARGVLDNDNDPEGDPLSATLVSSVANGVLVFNADGSFDYTPNSDFNGTDSFTYSVDDGLGVADMATALITIRQVNDAPVASDDNYAVDEDLTLASGAVPSVLANDFDIDGDPLTVSLIDDVSDGTLALTADGLFAYTPDADFNGVDSFRYRVSDGGGGSSTATASITVNPINDLPVSEDDSYSVDEDTLLSRTPANGLMANDADIDGDALSSTLVSGPTNGTLFLNPDGSFDYTSNPNFVGSDSFVYNVNDGFGGFDPATVFITVDAVNDAPTGIDDNYAVDEDGSLLVDPAFGVLVNDSDIEGDPLSISLASDVSNGSLSFNVDGSFSYTPDANFFGVDSFTYELSDGAGGRTPPTAFITVNPINDVPVGINDVVTGTENGVSTFNVVANDVDVDGDVLNITQILAGPANGTATIVDGQQIQYRPNMNFEGTDSIVYEVTDGLGGFTSATVDVTVEPGFEGFFELVETFETGYLAKLNVTNSGVMPADIWTVSVSGLNASGVTTGGWVNGLEAGADAFTINEGQIDYTTAMQNFFDPVETGESFSLFFQIDRTTAYDTDVGNFSFSSSIYEPPRGDGDAFLEVTPVITDTWQSGFSSEVTITNTSDQPVIDWDITLEFGRNLNVFGNWGSETSKVDGNSWSFTGLNWNRVLQPGESFNFGFNGDRRVSDIDVEDIVIG